MFAKFASKIGALFVQSETRRYEAYLASSSDLAELERRSRYLEASHNPFAFSYSDKSRDLPL